LESAAIVKSVGAGSVGAAVPKAVAVEAEDCLAHLPLVGSFCDEQIASAHLVSYRKDLDSVVLELLQRDLACLAPPPAVAFDNERLIAAQPLPLPRR
jgi:hypothetical protein